MDRKDLASKYWDAANGITAFACAQAIAFLLSLQSKDVQHNVYDPSNHWLNYWLYMSFTFVFWSLYFGCIWAVSNAGIRHLEYPEDFMKTAWKRALWVRLGMVSFFNALTIFALLLPPTPACK